MLGHTSGYLAGCHGFDQRILRWPLSRWPSSHSLRGSSRRAAHPAGAPSSRPNGPCAAPAADDGPRPADVPTSHWAADAVADAHRWGFLIGYPGSVFAGNHPITRGEYSILLHRLRMAALQRL